MGRYSKYAVTAAAGALIVFFLIGVVSGVPIVSALLRAILSGVLFGGGVFGVIVLAERFLPGLVPEDVPAEDGSTVDHDDESREEPAPGSRLNIVVDDESGIEDVPEDTAEGGAAEGDAANVDVVEEESVSEATPEVVPIDDESPPDDGEVLVEEVQEQTAEDAEEIMQAAIQEEQDGIEIAGDRSEFDDIPYIGSFAGSFVSSDYSENENGGYGVSGDGPAAGDAGNDPAQIARAIRTLLNKDEQT